MSEEALLFRLAGFELKVLRRQFPNATDYWDGNWLMVECECRAPGATVRANGPFVHLCEVVQLKCALEALQLGETGEKIIDLMEPELKMKFETGSRGHLQFSVALTSNHLDQSHRFSFDIDQSYLPEAIQQCSAILTAYPVRGVAE